MHWAQAVAADPAAIGMLPSAWAHDELKLILLGVRLPVLIATNTLEGPAAELVACLQGETGQAILGCDLSRNDGQPDPD